jgi:hypothetical protein
LLFAENRVRILGLKKEKIYDEILEAISKLNFRYEISFETTYRQQG